MDRPVGYCAAPRHEPEARKRAVRTTRVRQLSSSHVDCGDMTLPPRRSDEARIAALAKSAEVRRARADIRARLKSGSLTLAELLEQVDDPTVGGMKAHVVIESLPGVGKAIARRVMADVGIAESRRLRGLGDRQRASLLAVVG